MASRIDFKLSELSRLDDGTMEVRVRFSQGEYLDEIAFRAANTDWREDDFADVDFPIYVRAGGMKLPDSAFVGVRGLIQRVWVQERTSDSGLDILSFSAHMATENLESELSDVLATDLTREAKDDQRLPSR